MNYRALLLAFSILTAALSLSAVSAAAPVVAELADQTVLEGAVLGGANGFPVTISNGVAPFTYAIDNVNVEAAKPKLQVTAQNALGACPAGHAGICIDNAGKVSYTGKHSEIGVYTVTVTVTDANADSDTEDFKLTVANSDPDLSLAKLSKDVAVLSTTNTVAVSSNSANNAIVLAVNAQYQDKITERNVAEPIDAGIASGDSLKYSFSTEWTTFTMKDDGTISFTPTDADIGYHYVTLTATDSDGKPSLPKTVRYFVKDSADNEKLLIRNIDITDVSGDEDEHEPGDDFEVTLDVANLNNKDLESVKVKAWVAGVKDSTVKRYSERVQEDKFDLSAADTKDEITLKFKLSTDARKSTTDLTTYMALNIIAEGSDESGTLFTDAYVKEFKVTRQDHKVIFESIVFNPPEATCSGSTELAIRTVNIGNSNEDVTVNVKNNALGTSLSTGQFELKKEGSDAEEISRLGISVPATAKAQDYTLDVIASYNDGKTEMTEPHKLTVSCSGTAVASGTTTVASESVSGSTIAVQQASAVAERGQAVKYTITVTNTQGAEATYKLDVSGTQDWATASVEPLELKLASGASSQLFVYLTPRRDASAGDHSATVSVVSGTTVLSSKVLTTLVKAGTTTVEQFAPTGASALKLSGNTATIGFGALVILVAILAIVLVVTRNGKGNGKKVEKY